MMRLLTKSKKLIDPATGSTNRDETTVTVEGEGTLYNRDPTTVSSDFHTWKDYVELQLEESPSDSDDADGKTATITSDAVTHQQSVAAAPIWLIQLHLKILQATQLEHQPCRQLFKQMGQIRITIKDTHTLLDNGNEVSSTPSLCGRCSGQLKWDLPIDPTGQATPHQLTNLILE